MVFPFFPIFWFPPDHILVVFDFPLLLFPHAHTLVVFDITFLFFWHNHTLVVSLFVYLLVMSTPSLGLCHVITHQATLTSPLIPQSGLSMTRRSFILVVVAVTEDKWSSLTDCFILVSQNKILGPNECDCIDPMVVFWTWSLDQVWIYTGYK